VSPGPGSGAALAGVRLRFLIALAGVTGMVMLALAATAQARPKPRLQWIHCSPAARCPDPVTTLRRTWKARVAATNVTRRAKVVLHVRTGPRPTQRLKTRLVKPGRLVVRIPQAAVTGRVRVVMPGGRWSNARTVRVRAVPHLTSTPGVSADATAFSGNGMWIWNLPNSDGGDAQAIGARARAHDVTTVFVKSSDGTHTWSQFTPSTVDALKAEGLHVCAWQFVYGDSPVTEARRGAEAAEDGADCLVIDAESQYEHKYAQAHTYITRLRDAVGPEFPIGLAGFPYADYHPSYPFSVFLGPGGATYNVPQVYWQAIGDSVSTTLAHTYEFNQPYGRPIFPLGQSTGNTRTTDPPPPNRELVKFRQLAAAYGATGVSWWVYEGTPNRTWNAVGSPVEALGAPLTAPWPELHQGSAGDLVVWVQEHLAAAGSSVAITGVFRRSTYRALLAFQNEEGLDPTGVTDEATWEKLLTFKPVVPTWGASAARAASAAGAATGPASARLPARRNEIAGHRRLAAAR
jgi:hypothetical protein